jgi:hypothetical protein
MKKNIVLFCLFFFGTIVPDAILLLLRKGFNIYISIPQQNKILLVGIIMQILALIWYSSVFDKGERRWFSNIFALLSFVGLMYNIFTFILIAATNQAMNSFF